MTILSIQLSIRACYKLYFTPKDLILFYLSPIINGQHRRRKVIPRVEKLDAISMSHVTFMVLLYRIRGGV